ncbi:MAG: saccharopine dehydrogenase NADP-binding domain-containing protein [Actinobacteria bacterium]|nr:saccharopine dehydrogenase NADP-binding domain-containing protein [Actinomycetota bacterium]MBU1494945.1 saccharopine dehydrogenase NADP-binding domain-containing protein [Actinomycetota bacterium]
MSKINVLGTGIVGSAAAFDLVRRGHDVSVADGDPAAAARCGDLLGVPHVVIDAADGAAVAGFLEGCAAVVSAVPYGYGTMVAEAAIGAGCHYLDFGGNPSVVAGQLQLDGRARAAGIAVVPDCGLAPGFANVLTFAAADRLGDGPIDVVGLRVGGLPIDPEGTLEYQIAFSPGGLINEYAEPCEVLRDGAYATRPPLTGFETVEWEGWGPLEAFHTAGGSSSLPRLFEGRVRHLDYKTLRYPGHGRIFRAMLELGLFDETPVDAGGVAVAPRALLLERLNATLPSGRPDVVLLRAWAEADREGRRRAAGYQVVDRHDGTHSAMARTTAFPTTALAHLLATGALGMVGAATMDACVHADDLIPELAGTGIVIEDWVPQPA